MEQQNQQPMEEATKTQKGLELPKKSLFANKRLYILVAFIAIILTVAGILVLQMNSSPEPDQTAVQQIPASGAPTPSPKPSYDKSLYEGWAVYIDEESGYSLRVPPNWVSREFIEPHASEYFRVAFGAPDGILRFIREVDAIDAYKVYLGCNVVSVSEIPSRFSVEGTISQIMDNRSELDNAVRTEVFVGSKEAVQFDESIFPLDPQDRNPQLDGFTTFVKHNDSVFMLTGLSCETEKERFKNLYEMMLGSVQFFGTPKEEVGQPPVIETKTWPLYTHPELGYSLKMHPDFKGRSDAERFLVLTDEKKSCRHSQDNETKKWIAAELDIRAGLTEGIDEESSQLYNELLKADVNTEVRLLKGIVLKVADIDLDGRVAPQFLLENNYITYYIGERGGITFELEADCLDDLEKYRLLLNVAFSTFRFNNFNP